MSSLVDLQAAGQHRLHLVVREVGILLAVLRELFCIVRNELETRAVRIEDLAAAGAVQGSRALSVFIA